ncbi:UNVERIFIED_CONTAM: hypothetical protein K2H54_026410 [Gekko kuhli]
MAQACMLLQKALQTRQFRLSITDEEWEELIRESTNQVTETLKMVSEFKVKVDQEKVLKCLELLNFLLRTVTQQKLNVDLTDLREVLQALSQHEGFGKSTRLGNVYWNVMTLLGFTRPAKEKAPAQPKNPTEAEPVKRKKKGFLPASKKRSSRKKVPEQPEEKGAEKGKEAVADGTEAVPAKKRRKRNKRKRGGGGGDSQNKAPKQQGSVAKKPKLPPGSAKETDSKLGNLKKKKKKARKGRKPVHVDGK